MDGRAHAPAPKHDGLQIDDDARLQQRTWRIQRLGWLGFVALVLAGLVGLFGSGPLSRATAIGDGVRVEYDRFARLHAPATLLVSIDRAALRDGAVRLVLTGDYIRDAQIQSSTLPVVGLAPGGIVLGAAVDDDAADLIAAIHLTFSRPGPVQARLGLAGRNAAVLSHWIYP